MSLNLKPTNPKDLIGSNKLPLHLWPATATAVGCLGMLDGALKYGRNNWRDSGVLASVYIAAAMRHVLAYYEGEECAADSGVPHLGHFLSCGAILIDAKAQGNLIDDRQYPGGYLRLVEELTPLVSRLREAHAGKNPKHFTIADAPAPVTTLLQQPTSDAHDVVVGVLLAYRQDGARVFLQKRSHDDRDFAGAWECPGGGVENGESDAQALERELKEEIGVHLLEHVEDPIWTGEIAGYRGKRLRFRFYLVTAWQGAPEAKDGQPDLDWFDPSDGVERRLTPANLCAWPAIIEAVRKATSFGYVDCVALGKAAGVHNEI